MVYKTASVTLGLTIIISSHRKHGNGAKGGGRKNSSGKKAVVFQKDKDPITLTGSTTSELMKSLRAQFRIPSSIVINPKGETSI